MTTLILTDVPTDLRHRLRVRATATGPSINEEAELCLVAGLRDDLRGDEGGIVPPRRPDRVVEHYNKTIDLRAFRANRGRTVDWRPRSLPDGSSEL